ncbi:DUF983 domain-containing protein [Chitinophaga agrisoli]|uniref:DUF983 domain-containing protein n=1 Tax=Chitinophaga agrisoli TaxID=2607653 RepID=A0A5B2VZS8_9BACT|nr:DUF983 domain-containing protein [Chitinophaga agrisoli]KAA2243647.1 DUF983 domain-containing protein [Chitinophaga agrisoli]
MCAHQQDSKPNLLLSVLQNKCPRCRQGKLYKHSHPYRLKDFMDMNEYCDVCGQPFEPETGFYFGTGYVSYALSIALSVASFIAWWLFIGISVYDNRLFWWIGVNAVILLIMQPLLMRLSRTIWLSFFVYYDRNWYTNKIVH